MKIVNNVKLSVFEDESKLLEKAKKASGDKSIKYIKIKKKSLDARNKDNIFYLYSLLCDSKPIVEEKKQYGKITNKGNILVVGAGPSGLFCALDLLRYGFNVTLIERGDKVEDRKVKVNSFLNGGTFDEESNVQFGEGGAGAFSDGKLNTQVSSQYVKEVINDFVYFGAPLEVGYLNKPHIGSDNLPKVVKNIRNEILALGGKILYRTKLTDIKISNGKVASVYINNEKFTFDEVVLAVGHSARDVYYMLDREKVFMQPKNFAVGFRIEHLQKEINLSQYGEKYYDKLPSSEYKLVSHKSQKGVFTFCMCPGGEVIASNSEKNTIVTNGMSNFSRDGVNSNSAIICQVDSSDFGDNLFSGLEYQKQLEQKAFILGGEDYKAPVQLVEDYINNVKSTCIKNVQPSYRLGYKFANLENLFSNKINEALKLGILDMSTKIQGFSNGVLTGVESRTSAPIQVTRSENLNSVNVENLYPCGEGCGYAGGISSAGADGKKVAFKLAIKYGLNQEY